MKSLRLSALALAALLQSIHSAPAIAQTLPPGVALAPFSSADAPPVGYRADSIVVDWTSPLLRLSLDNFVRPDAPPVPLDRLASRDAAPALRIQLSEPLPEGSGRWRLALPFADKATTGSLPTGAMSVNGGWRPVAGIRADGPAVGTRWIGSDAQLADLPALQFSPCILLAINAPGAGSSRFILIESTGADAGRLSELRDWLARLMLDGDTLTIHSQGADTWIAQGDWRLGANRALRGVPRAGAVLTLRGLQPGESVDWLRMPGVRVRSSKSEPGFGPEEAIGGLGGAGAWRGLLNPALWIASPLSDSNKEIWIEVELDAARSIERIEVEWASAAGWSPHFNPGLCRLQVSAATNADPETVLEIRRPQAAVVWKARGLNPIRRIRLSFPEPSADPLDGRARVAAIRAIGPWDGEAGSR